MPYPCNGYFQKPSCNRPWILFFQSITWQINTGNWPPPVPAWNHTKKILLFASQHSMKLPNYLSRNIELVIANSSTPAVQTHAFTQSATLCLHNMQLGLMHPRSLPLHWTMAHCCFPQMRVIRPWALLDSQSEDEEARFGLVAVSIGACTIWTNQWPW